MVAEGLDPPEAWHAAAALMGKSKGSSDGWLYRKRSMERPEYRARMAALMAEKEQLEQAGEIGVAMWSARQYFRIAMAKGDLTGIGSAAKLIHEVTKTMGEERPQPDKPPGEQATPGRRSIKNPQNGLDFDRLKKNLMRIGVPVEREAEVAELAEADEA